MNKKYLKPLFISLLASIILELCFFNFNSLLSRIYDKNIDYKIYYDEQFQAQTDGSHILNNNYASIEIYDIQGDIKNIYIDFDITSNKLNDTAFIDYYVKDEGYSDYYYNTINYRLPLTNAAYGSRFHNIDGSGNVLGLLLKIYNDNDCSIKINNITLNETKPIQFSVGRLIITFSLILCFSLIFIYKLGLNTHFFNLDKNKQNIVNSILIIIAILLSITLGTINKVTANNEPNNFYSSHYVELTNSLLNGHVSIDGINDELKSLDNPYDLYRRSQNIDDTTLSTYFDYAYFNNKFYVYFGIGPALLYFTPYKIITGHDFASYKANIISFVIFSIGLLFLINKILSKHYNSISITLYIITYLFAASTSGALILLTVSSFYTVPILFSLAFAISGLTLWTYSINNNHINKLLLILGSVFMSLTLLGRPQLMLLAVLGIFIYYDYVKDSKHNISNILLALIPFIVVCIGVGYYNYIRFNSPLDFGATYNITTNDMTKRGFSINRIGLGLFTYLLQPYKINTIFPFIQSVDISSAYTGMITNEYTYGGLFSINPITLLPLSLPFIYKEKNRLSIASLVLFFLGIIVVLFDTQYAGLLDRYYSDFSIFFILSSLIALIILLNNNFKGNNSIILIIVFFMLFSILFNYLRLFGTADYQSLQICNPHLYYKLQYLFQFWL